MILFYSRELRRTFQAVLLSFEHILQLVIFILVMVFLTALIGTQVIGDMDGSVHYDPYIQNFNDFLVTSNLLYTLISFDPYPDLMIPAINYSSYYLLYFIPFVTLLLLLLLPVPVAIVFEAFRVHRCQMALQDRIK